MSDLIGKTKHEIEDALNARALECPPDISGDAAKRLLTRIEELERDNKRLRLFIASDVSRAVGIMESLPPSNVAWNVGAGKYLETKSQMAEVFAREAEKLQAAASAALRGEAP